MSNTITSRLSDIKGTFHSPARRRFIRRIAAATLLGMTGSSCVFTSPAKSEPTGPADPWLTATTPEAAAVVVLLHGLNNRPAVMRPLQQMLADNGYHTFLVSLRGHGPHEQWAHIDYAEAWREDLQRAVHIASARFPRQPVYVLAYSLGAAICSRYLLDCPAAVGKVFFLAPALAFTATAGLIRLLLPLRFLGIRLPSFAPEKYRAHATTSLQAYEGGWKLLQQIEERRTSPGFEALRARDILSALSTEDELIGFQDLLDWIKERELSAWRLLALAPQPEDAALPRHLIVDEESLGAAEWQLLCRAILDHFSA
jgi:pimeloyl-ACP methyl ester carboxylesterase